MIDRNIFPKPEALRRKSKKESAAHSSRTLPARRYQIPALLKKSRGKANSFPPAKIVLLCLVHIVIAAPRVKRGAEQKDFLFLLEEKIGGARKSKIEKKTFLLAGERQRAAAGRSVSFVQNRFGFGRINAPKQNLTVFQRPNCGRREARPTFWL